MSRAKNTRTRDYLYKEFAKRNITYPDSHGNYIWANVGKRNLSELMRPVGLVARNSPWANGEWARITIGTAEHMKTFVNAL